MLTKFLYGSRAKGEDGDLLGNEGDALQFGSTQVVVSSSDGSSGPPPAASNSNRPLASESPVLVGASATSSSGRSSGPASGASFGSAAHCDTPKPLAISDYGIMVGGQGVPEVQILDPVIASPAHELARQRRHVYESNRVFQDTWAARLPWAESMVTADGSVRQVRCKTCSEVEGRDKLLVPKIDSLWKHCGRRKATTNFGKVVVGQYYFLSNNAHIKNEFFYFARNGKAADTVVQQVAQGEVREHKRKLVQFRVVLWVLMRFP
jgi:hypothetical protein